VSETPHYYLAACPKNQCHCPGFVPKSRASDSRKSCADKAQLQKTHVGCAVRTMLQAVRTAHPTRDAGFNQVRSQLLLFKPVLFASAIASLRSATCNFEMMLET
jgi:hypothetical protein